MNKRPKADATVTVLLDEKRPGIPTVASMQQWAQAALLPKQSPCEVTIKVVSESESRDLNARHRQRDYPTNVLSFPMQSPPELDLPILGDLAICATVVEREAHAQNKPLDAHWAHMVVHGMLHLQGLDHIDEAEAERMEDYERAILAQLGYDNPYG